ncbi:MAG: 2-hydroxyacyl-CoA dehydratase [Desulfobacterales bacterium]|nr:2-hydroxyacyl-CoA dehydratase [Desulfobacterales bacterium]
MMLQYFKGLESGLQNAIQKGQASPRKLYSLEIARLGTRLYSGQDKVAWCGITAPFDVLNAMGMTSCFVEFIGAMLASTGVVGSFIDETDQIGYSSDSCSYHRAVTGATMKGLMPVPELLIGTTSPCSGGLAVLENIASHFNKQLFVLHIPQDESISNIQFLANQIREMVNFIRHITGISLDMDRLRLAVEHTNKTRELMVAVYDFAKQVPSPTTNKELSNFGIVMALFLGTEAAVHIAKSYYDEFEKRVKSNSGKSNEKIRLMWIQNRIQFKHPLESLLADEYKACIVVDELNDITWEPIDPNTIFEDIARRSISIPFNGTIQNRVKHLQKLAQEYKIDGAINPCNWGCRQGTGARGLIEDGLKEIGVPVLNLEVDCIDSRKFTEGQLKTRIEAFIEMIDARK